MESSYRARCRSIACHDVVNQRRCSHRELTGSDAHALRKDLARMSRVARIFLAIIGLVVLAAPWIAPADYAEQFRNHAGEPPGRHFFLGVDDLGRDRFSRLLYGARVSL